MNARRCHDGCSAWIVPIALLVALWQAIASFGYCAGVAAAAARSGVHAPRAGNWLTGTFQH